VKLLSLLLALFLFTKTTQGKWPFDNPIHSSGYQPTQARLTNALQQTPLIALSALLMLHNLVAQRQPLPGPFFRETVLCVYEVTTRFINRRGQ
jgi:hypothetical protein